MMFSYACLKRHCCLSYYADRMDMCMSLSRFWISFSVIYRTKAKWATFGISEFFWKISYEKNKLKFEISK